MGGGTRNLNRRLRNTTSICDIGLLFHDIRTGIFSRHSREVGLHVRSDKSLSYITQIGVRNECSKGVDRGDGDVGWELGFDIGYGCRDFGYRCAAIVDGFVEYGNVFDEIPSSVDLVDQISCLERVICGRVDSDNQRSLSIQCIESGQGIVNRVAIDAI